MRHGKASVLLVSGGWWQPLITDGVLTQKGCEKSCPQLAEAVIYRKIDAFVSNYGVGLLCRPVVILVCYNTLADFTRDGALGV